VHSRLAARSRGVDGSPLGRGAVTAELALTLPAIGLVLAIVLGGIGLAIDRGRLAQAAADGQRVHSYGGTPAEVTGYVHRVLGTGDATVAISEGPGEHVSCVTVMRPGFSWLEGLVAEAREATSCGLVVPR
jgi:hypothetical protein